MRFSKWLALACLATLIISCFMPWVSIPGKELVITGMDATALNFGKPAYIHLVLSSIIILLLLIGRVWSLVTSFFISAFNVAWALRNFVAISSCSGGLCPEKHIALYLLLITALAAAAFGALIPHPKKKGALPPEEKSAPTTV